MAKKRNIREEYIVDNINQESTDPNEAYLIPITIDKHSRVVTDQNNEKSVQIDPTIPDHVRNITQTQIDLWSTHTHTIAQVTGLQTALDGKQDKLSSYDESILIENSGNIEGNVSLFEEYYNQQVCELNFTPIQIIGVYLNGIKQKPSLYTIIPPKTISVTNFVTNDYVEIQYTKLKI